MKYYVNSLGGDFYRKLNIRPNKYIGLFRRCETEGRGTYCGYYATEYYINTELLAGYVAEGPSYSPEKRITPIDIFNKKIKEQEIVTHMWTLVIEADTDEEAIEKFKNADWRRFEDGDCWLGEGETNE